MQNHEFLSEVQKGIGAATSDESATATRAVLQTLADHLAGNAPAKLAAQLPEEIGAFITDHKNDPDAEGEGFGVEEFVKRAAERGAGSDSETVKKRAIAVFAVLHEAISAGEFDKMRGTLPPEYDALFGEGTFERSRVGAVE